MAANSKEKPVGGLGGVTPFPVLHNGTSVVIAVSNPVTAAGPAPMAELSVQVTEECLSELHGFCVETLDI